MAIYSVCSLFIQADNLSHGFKSFLMSDAFNPGSIDLNIEYVPGTYTIKNPGEKTELPYMTVWKELLPGNHCNWVYVIKNQSGTILIDEEYKQIRIYYSDFVGYLNKKDIAEVFSPYIQILLECKLIKNGYVVLHSAW